MPASAQTRLAPDLLTRMTSLLTYGDEELYSFSPDAQEKLREIVVESSMAPNAVEEIGLALKLVHVLETEHESPTAAEALLEALRRSPDALRIIAKHWSSGESRPRVGADLAPVERVLAPHVGHTQASGPKLSEFLTPGRDARGTHMRRKRDRTIA